MGRKSPGNHKETGAPCVAEDLSAAAACSGGGAKNAVEVPPFSAVEPEERVDLDRALAAGIAKRHAEKFCRPEPIKSTTAMAAVVQFQTTPQLWCLSLVGVRGVGKTFAAEWLLYRLLAREPTRSVCLPFLYTPLGLLPGLGDQNFLQYLQRTSLLVIDDLGTEHLDRSGRMGGVLFEVINARWRSCRRTVITSNLGPDCFRRRYGASIGDRLSQDAMCVVCLGQSLRTDLSEIG